MKAFLPVMALLAIATCSIGAQDITVRRADGSERRLSTTELATLPRLDFEEADHGVMTRFEGVELLAILRLAAAGPTDSLRGPALRRVVVLIGADGYAATIALADVDPGLGARRVYVVNRANGGRSPRTKGRGARSSWGTDARHGGSASCSASSSLMFDSMGKSHADDACCRRASFGSAIRARIVRSPAAEAGR